MHKHFFFWNFRSGRTCSVQEMHVRIKGCTVFCFGTLIGQMKKYGHKEISGGNMVWS